MTRTTRETETREHEMRPSPELSNINLRTLPRGVQKDGYEYWWTRAIEGDSCLSEKLSKGWSIVPTERAQSDSYIHPFEMNSERKKCIWRQDTILMERPSIYSQYEKDIQNRQGVTSTREIKGYVGYTGTPSIHALPKMETF